MKIRLKRLLELQSLVLNHPDDEFNTENWVSVVNKTKCAGGIACTHPKFMKKGLSLDSKNYPVYSRVDEKKKDRNGGTPKNKGKHLAQFFGITYEEADDIFLGCNLVPYSNKVQKLYILGKISKIISKEMKRRSNKSLSRTQSYADENL